MAENRRSVPSSAVAVTVTVWRGLAPVLETTDGQALATGQPERGRRLARGELEREDAHPDEVRAMDALVALGQDHPDAEERRALGRPVTRRPGAVLPPGDDRRRDALGGVAHRPCRR